MLAVRLIHWRIIIGPPMLLSDRALQENKRRNCPLCFCAALCQFCAAEFLPELCHPRGRDSNSQNEAFILSDPETRKKYEESFAVSRALYYGKKPSFDEILGEIKKRINRL